MTVASKLFTHEEGVGVPVVMLHGGMLDHRVFTPLARILGVERRCVRIDFPGCGASPSIDRFTLDGLADAIFEAWGDFIKRPEPVDLVGVSLGAGVAVRLAARRPQGLRSIALLSFTGAARPGSDVSTARALSRRNPAQFAHGFAERMTTPRDPPSVRAHIKAMAMSTPPSARESLFDLIATYPDLGEEVASATLPVAFISGAADISFDRGRIEALAKRTISKVSVVEGAGHLAVLTHPQTVAAQLRQFWSELR